MPWKCPACGSPIQHTEDIPNPAVTYRCSVCRLELRVTPDTSKLAVVPIPDDGDSAQARPDRVQPRPAKA
jgi:hypothetical protein